MAEDDTAEALGILKFTKVRHVTIAMPKGGFKNARVIKSKVSLPRVLIRDDGDDDSIPPRQRRR